MTSLVSIERALPPAVRKFRIIWSFVYFLIARNGKKSLTLRFIGLLLAFVLLSCWMRDLLVATGLSAQQTSISAPCTLYASPGGNDKNSGAARTSPKTFR